MRGFEIAVVATLVVAGASIARAQDEAAPPPPIKRVVDRILKGEDALVALREAEDARAAVAWIASHVETSADHGEHPRFIKGIAGHEGADQASDFARWLAHRDVDCQLAALDVLAAAHKRGTIKFVPMNRATVGPLARALVPLVASQVVPVSEKASALLEKLSWGQSLGRDVAAWRRWYEDSFGEPLDFGSVTFEVIAGVGKLPDAWLVNGIKLHDGDALAEMLKRLETGVAEPHRVPLRIVFVEAPPFKFTDAEKAVVTAVANRKIASVPYLVVPPAFEQLAPTPPPPFKEPEVVVVGIFLDKKLGDRTIVIYDDPNKRGRIYDAGDFVRDRNDRNTAIKVLKIEEGRVTFALERVPGVSADDAVVFQKELKAP